MRKTLLICLAMFVIGFVAMFCLTGCAPSHPTSAATPTSGFSPQPLAAVATSLNHLIIWSVVAVGVGVALFFLLPAAHATSLSIAAVAAGIEVSALVTRESLWLVPWLCWALAALAVSFFCYEVWVNRVALEAAANNAAAMGRKLASETESSAVNLITEVEKKL